MRLIRTVLFAAVTSAILVTTPGTFAAGYELVEGYNVLDTNNAPVFATGDIGTNFAATAGQERDIAVDAARGIIYIARGQGTVPDGRSVAQGAPISAFMVGNGVRSGSNFRDTGLIAPVTGSAGLTFCQSLAYDQGSDKLWVLGSPLGANPIIYSAPGGTVGGAPNGDGISAINNALIREFQVNANLPDGIANHGRVGQPRGFAVRTVGTNTTVYLGMGNHAEAWSNDQALQGTNSPWRRIWATLRPPAQNLVSSRVATNFTGVNGIAVDDGGNCYFSVQTTGGRIWCVRPGIAAGATDPMSLDYNDLAFGGSSERDIIPVIYSASAAAPVITPPQSITFCRFGSQRSLFVSSLPAATTRAVTRLDIADDYSFTNSGAYIPGVAVDGFGSGQPAGGQDSILSTMRLKAGVGVTQPYGATSGLLYTDVDSVTNPTYIYADAFVTDTTKGQSIPTAAVLKIRIPDDTNAASITTQPVGQTLLEGGTISLSFGATGQRPLSYQWQSNSVDIPGATNQNFGISPASTNDTGQYRVIVANIHGSVTSTQALVTVRPLVRSLAMTLVWSNAPGSRPYLTTDNNQRGLAYCADGNFVVVVSRSPSNAVYLLDAETGTDVQQLILGSEVTGGTTFPINAVGTSPDGHVYVANLAQNAETFRIYRWDFAPNDAPAQVAYSGTPFPGGLRWGDTLDVRGSGNDIQILAGSRASNVVAIFTTTDGGQNFTVTPVRVAAAPNGAFGVGIAFGRGNTFWGKGDQGTALRLVEFDLAAGTGTVLKSFGSSMFPANAIPISIETNLNLLAAVAIENPDNLQLYNIADLEAGPVLLDQELFPTDNENGNATGAVDFGGGKVFALDSNNGIIALTLGSTQPGPGRISITRDGTNVTLTWEGTFTLQAATVVTGPYNDIATAASGYSENTSTNGPERYFRLRN